MRNEGYTELWLEVPKGLPALIYLILDSNIDYSFTTLDSVDKIG